MNSFKSKDVSERGWGGGGGMGCKGYGVHGEGGHEEV